MGPGTSLASEHPPSDEIDVVVDRLITCKKKELVVNSARRLFICLSNGGAVFLSFPSRNNFNWRDHIFYTINKRIESVITHIF